VTCGGSSSVLARITTSKNASFADSEKLMISGSSNACSSASRFGICPWFHCLLGYGAFDWVSRCICRGCK
jgi:hypothetical protein